MEDFGVLNPAGWQDQRRPNFHQISKIETMPEIQIDAASPGAILFSSIAWLTMLMAQVHMYQTVSLTLSSA